MRVVILGAGAMGCLYATYLAKNKNIDLLLLDHNRDRVRTIQEQGLVKEENAQTYRIPVHAELSGDEAIGQADVLLLFVKAHQTYAAMKGNSFLIGPDTTVVSLQNGMGNYIEIGKFVPLDQVVIGTSNHNSTIIGYGHFLHAADGKTIIGSFADSGERVDIVRKIFEKTGLDIESSADVRRLIWRKVLVNMSINPLTMLLEVKNGFIQADRHSWECVERILDEGLAVAKADGCEFDREEILELIHKICLVTGSGCSSMFQDRINGRPTEIDFINGTVVKLARKYHLDVPCNTMLVKLVRAAENACMRK